MSSDTISLSSELRHEGQVGSQKDKWGGKPYPSREKQQQFKKVYFKEMRLVSEKSYYMGISPEKNLVWLKIKMPNK